MEIIRGCVFSALACTAFAVGFNIRPRYLPFASLGAFMSELVFSLPVLSGTGEVRASFIGAAAAALYSEIMARLLRVPANMYLTVSIIPLVPGGMLYRTMLRFVMGDLAGGIELAAATIGVAGAVAMGIFIVSSLFRYGAAVRQGRFKK